MKCNPVECLHVRLADARTRPIDVRSRNRLAERTAQHRTCVPALLCPLSTLAHRLHLNYCREQYGRRVSVVAVVVVARPRRRHQTNVARRRRKYHTSYVRVVTLTWAARPRRVRVVICILIIYRTQSVQRTVATVARASVAERPPKSPFMSRWHIIIVQNNITRRTERSCARASDATHNVLSACLFSIALHYVQCVYSASPVNIIISRRRA